VLSRRPTHALQVKPRSSSGYQPNGDPGEDRGERPAEPSPLTDREVRPTQESGDPPGGTRVAGAKLHFWGGIRAAFHANIQGRSTVCNADLDLGRKRVGWRIVGQGRIPAGRLGVIWQVGRLSVKRVQQQR
jgi:hypothetical protein